MIFLYSSPSAFLPPSVTLRASASLLSFAYVDLRAYALIGHTPRSETPMVAQQVDHMICVCVCVCERVGGVRRRGSEGGMREEEEKEEEGYSEWLQAATSLRDFFSSKRLSRERWRLLPPVGR